jgi:hypothetical protein
MDVPDRSDKEAPRPDDLSVEEAFDAACLFVERYREVNREVGIDRLLRDIESSGAGSEAASWSDWLQCAEEISAQRRASQREYGVRGTRYGVPVIGRATPRESASPEPPAVRLRLQQAFDAALEYIQHYRGLELVDLLSDSQLGGPGATIDPAAWDHWLRGVGRVTARSE